MKIRLGRRLTSFRNLEVGRVFEFKGRLFIRTCLIEQPRIDQKELRECNAVDLSNGLPENFLDNWIVSDEGYIEIFDNEDRKKGDEVE